MAAVASMNSSDQEKVGRSFGRSFSSYDKEASTQASTAEKLVSLLRKHHAPRGLERVLEFGCGTGALTKKLRTEFEIATLVVNDLTPAAELTAKKYAAQFLQGDANQVALPERQNLVAASSMVQWIDDLEGFFGRVDRALDAGGWLAFSGFGQRQFHELAELGSKANAPSLMSAKDLSELARRSFSGGLEILECDEMVEEMWFASPTSVLRHLRHTGVNGKAQMGWTKADLRQFSEKYVSRFGGSKGVPLSYHTTWFIARKS